MKGYLRTTCRRMNKLNDLVIPKDEQIILIDNGCDISIISNNYYLTSTFTGICLNVDGDLSDMKSNNL